MLGQVSERGLCFHDPVAGQNLLSLTERGEALERERQGRERELDRVPLAVGGECECYNSRRPVAGLPGWVTSRYAQRTAGTCARGGFFAPSR